MALLHTREQGLRVHGLANLGGLVAIAGLEDVEPPLLLGVLLDLAEQLPDLDSERRRLLTERGRERLHERNAEKRAWKAYQRARDLHRVDLTSEQIRTVLDALGVLVPDSPDELVAALSEGLGATETPAQRGSERRR